MNYGTPRRTRRDKMYALTTMLNMCHDPAKILVASVANSNSMTVEALQAMIDEEIAKRARR
jgi:hypothetical protein